MKQVKQKKNMDRYNRLGCGFFLIKVYVGKDATESFEDIGHSDEAREILSKYLVGELDEAVSKKKK